MSGSVEDEHRFLFDCPAYSHIRQQYSHLPPGFPFSSSFSVDQPNRVDSYLETYLAQTQPV